MNELKKSNPIEISNYDPVLMTRTCAEIKSLADAVSRDPNSISLLKKNIGEIATMNIVEAHLFTLNESINAHEKLTPFQCAEIVVEITNSYYYMSIVEIHYVLRLAKRGDYGKINYAISMPDVLRWFHEYSEKRVAHFMAESTKHIHRDSSDRSEDRKIKERHEQLMREYDSRRNDI